MADSVMISDSQSPLPLMQPKMPELHKSKLAEPKVSYIGSRPDAGGFYSRPVTKKLAYEHHEKIYN